MSTYLKRLRICRQVFSVPKARPSTGTSTSQDFMAATYTSIGPSSSANSLG
eukprot:m.295610 g.295610  ORF g.295610 m.295610 type:complete len:51 (-) comp55154_c0_seq40:151-303(-)